MSEHNRYELVFEGYSDFSETTVRRVKSCFIADLEFTVSEIQAILHSLPAVVRQAETEADLRRSMVLLQKAGARVSIQPVGETESSSTEEFIDGDDSEGPALELSFEIEAIPQKKPQKIWSIEETPNHSDEETKINDNEEIAPLSAQHNSENLFYENSSSENPLTSDNDESEHQDIVQAETEEINQETPQAGSHKVVPLKSFLGFELDEKQNQEETIKKTPQPIQKIQKNEEPPLFTESLSLDLSLEDAPAVPEEPPPWQKPKDDEDLIISAPEAPSPTEPKFERPIETPLLVEDQTALSEAPVIKKEIVSTPSLSVEPEQSTVESYKQPALKSLGQATSKGEDAPSPLRPLKKTKFSKHSTGSLVGQIVGGALLLIVGNWGYHSFMGGKPTSITISDEHDDSEDTSKNDQSKGIEAEGEPNLLWEQQDFDGIIRVLCNGGATLTDQCSIEITTPKPLPLSPVEIGMGKVRPPWLVRAESDVVKLVDGRACGKARAYVEYREERNRVVPNFCIELLKGENQSHPIPAVSLRYCAHEEKSQQSNSQQGNSQEDGLSQNRFQQDKVEENKPRIPKEPECLIEIHRSVTQPAQIIKRK